MIDADAIRSRWETVGSNLKEPGRRTFAAAEVRTAGWGGLAVVSRTPGSPVRRSRAQIVPPQYKPAAKVKQLGRSKGTRRSLQSLTAFQRAVVMYLVQILLPRADNAGRPFGREDFDRVKEDLASRFDGVTAYLQAPAEGQWQDGEQSSKDDIVIFEVMGRISTCRTGANGAPS